jgi:glycine/D-amino acid oxidase-like deaminating enzyme
VKELIDYLIVGQGIAGTCLALELEQAGKRFHLVTSENHPASSQVAAGLMHPITGRRIVKTWKCDEIFPFSRNFYKKYERLSGYQFYYEMDCIEMVTTVKSLNDWNERSGENGLSDYITAIENNNRAYLKENLGLFRISKGGWINLPQFLDYFRIKWIKEELLTEAEFTLHETEFHTDHIVWRNHGYRHVVFCQGFHAFESNLWNWLPFESSKGELLTVRIPGLPETEIVMNSIFILPLGNELFRVGSTYDRSTINWELTEAALQELTGKLAHTINLPFEVLEQKAGIRPAAKDRKPVLGTHPLNRNYHIFNGLGSKGGSLAPYLANHLVSHLVKGSPLFQEVDVRQHWKE